MSNHIHITFKRDKKKNFKIDDSTITIKHIHTKFNLIFKINIRLQSCIEIGKIKDTNNIIREQIFNETRMASQYSMISLSKAD